MKNLQVVHLGQPVKITGFDIFGRSSQVGFIPSQESSDGWQIQAGPFGKRMSIDFRLIRGTKKPRIDLVDDDGKPIMSIAEHLMPIRMTGLCGVTVVCDSPWMPHLKTSDLWSEIHPHIINPPQQQEIKWFRPISNSGHFYPDLRDGKEAYTQMYGTNDRQIVIDVILSHKGIGYTEAKYVFPGSEILERVFSARAPGLPHCLYFPSKIVGTTGFWLHHNKFAWKNGTKDPGQLLQEWADHRALDILGALMCWRGRYMPSVHVISHLSGHYADIMAINQVANHVREL